MHIRIYMLGFMWFGSYKYIYDSCCAVIQKCTGRVRSRSFFSGSDRAKVVCGTLCLVGFISIVCIMSWQDYVDKQLLASRCVTRAAIAGHDGNVWAKSDGFEVSIL